VELFTWRRRIFSNCQEFKGTFDRQCSDLSTTSAMTAEISHFKDQFTGLLNRWLHGVKSRLILISFVIGLIIFLLRTFDFSPLRRLSTHFSRSPQSLTKNIHGRRQNEKRLNPSYIFLDFEIYTLA